MLSFIFLASLISELAGGGGGGVKMTSSYSLTFQKTP